MYECALGFHNGLLHLHLNKSPLIFFCSAQVPGTAESARSCVRAYFADLHEMLCRQEEMALSVVDAQSERGWSGFDSSRRTWPYCCHRCPLPVCTARKHCSRYRLDHPTQSVGSKQFRHLVGLLLCFLLGWLQGVLAKQEINRLLETLQKQQQQFTELADHILLDAGIPVTFTKVSWPFCVIARLVKLVKCYVVQEFMIFFFFLVFRTIYWTKVTIYADRHF